MDCSSGSMDSAASSGMNSDSVRWSESEEKGDNEENMVIVDLAGRGLKKLESLPTSETHATCTTLILDHNGLSRIDNLQEFKNLQQLSIGHNRLVRMNGISRLPTIRVLNLPNNSIQTIEGLRELPELEWLNLSGNSIKSIDHLSSNLKLRHLDLSDNSVSSIMDISMLANLKTLLLHGNILTTLRSIPGCIPHSLEILSLAENEISDLTEVSYLSCLNNLQQLSVMNNPCVLMATPCSSNASPFNSGFDYRPYIVNWSPSLHILDGYAITHKENLKAEWLYSQGKGRWYHPGQHVQLVQYLNNTCPLTVVSETQAKEDERLMRILQQQKKYQQLQHPFPVAIGGVDPAQAQLPSPSPSTSPQAQAQGQAQGGAQGPSTQSSSLPSTPSSFPSSPVGNAPAGSTMRPTRLSPTKLTPSMPGQKGGNGGQKSPTKRMPSPLRSPSPSKLLSPGAAWPSDRNENSQLHRNFKPVGENSPPAGAADVFLQDIEDGEIDQLGPLASFLPHHPSMPRDAQQTRPSTAPPQQQQQQPQHHATKHSKAKPNAASEEYTDVHPMRQSHGITDTASFASQVRAQLEKTQSGGDASSPVSKFQAYEDRPVKSLATNMLKKQLEGGGSGHGRVTKKGSQPTLRQSSSLPSTPSPRHSSSSLPSTPTPRSPHDFHHTSKAGREKGRSHLGKQRGGGGGGGGSSGDLRGASSGSKADHGKHGKETASSRKQGKGQSGRHWEVNGNPDFERPEAEQMTAQEAWAGGGKEESKDGAASTIQSNWRGHHARKGDEKAGRAQKQMQEQRVEEHIKYLNMELDRTRQMYEQEKHLRELQMEALKLLWNQVKTLQEWKQDVDGRDAPPPPGGPLPVPPGPPSITTPSHFQGDPKGTPGSASSSKDAKALSAGTPVSTVREVQLEKTCSSLQKQVGRLQESINGITTFITSGYVTNPSTPSPPFPATPLPTKDQPLTQSASTKDQSRSASKASLSRVTSQTVKDGKKSPPGNSNTNNAAPTAATTGGVPSSQGVTLPAPWEGAMINQALNNLPEGLHPLDVQQLLISAAKWMSEQAGVSGNGAGAGAGAGAGVNTKAFSQAPQGSPSVVQAGHFLPDEKDQEDAELKPTAPAELVATARSDTSIALKWTPSSMPGEKEVGARQLISPIKGYKLFIQLGESHREVMDVPYPQAILGGLTPGTYRFTVRGVGPNSESDDSNTDQVILPQSPSTKKASPPAEAQKTSPAKQRPVASPRSSKENQKKSSSKTSSSEASKDSPTKSLSKKSSSSASKGDALKDKSNVGSQNAKNDAKTAREQPKAGSGKQGKAQSIPAKSRRETDIDAEPSVVDLEDGLKVAIAKSVGVEMSQNIIDTAIQMAIIALIDVGPDLEGTNAMEEEKKNGGGGAIEVVPVQQLEVSSQKEGPQVADQSSEVEGRIGEKTNNVQNVSKKVVEGLGECQKGNGCDESVANVDINDESKCNGVQGLNNTSDMSPLCNGESQGSGDKESLGYGKKYDITNSPSNSEQETAPQTESEGKGLQPKQSTGSVSEASETVVGGAVQQPATKANEETVFNFDFQGGIPYPQSPTGIDDTSASAKLLGVSEQKDAPPVKSPKPKPSPRLSKLAANFTSKPSSSSAASSMGEISEMDESHRVSVGHDPFSVDFEESLPVSDCDDSEDRTVHLRSGEGKAKRVVSSSSLEDSRMSSDEASPSDHSASASKLSSKQIVSFCLAPKPSKPKPKEVSASARNGEEAKMNNRSKAGDGTEQSKPDERPSRATRPTNIKTILSPLNSPMVQQRSRNIGGSGIPMVRVPSPTKTGFLRLGGGVHRTTSTPSLETLKSPGGNGSNGNSNGQNKTKPESPSTDSSQHQHPLFARSRSKSGGSTLSSPSGGGGQSACKGRIKAGKKGSKVPQIKRSGSEPNLYLQKQLEAEDELEMQSEADGGTPIKQRRGSAGSQANSNKHSRLMSPGSTSRISSPGGGSSKLPIKHSTSTQNLSMINGSSRSSSSSSSSSSTASAAAAKRATSPGPINKRGTSPGRTNKRGTSPGPTKRGTSPGPTKRGTSPGPSGKNRAISPGRTPRTKQVMSPTAGFKMPSSSVSNANNSNSDECTGKLSKMAKMYRNLHKKEVKNNEDNANNNNGNKPMSETSINSTLCSDASDMLL
ncbi:mucin-19 isoform X2 [Strongylocentrotus purpuratus]|uniref:Centrosomal protein of 97 kDa n=1 Tax=Strongylocentrotus purpuratus TaxID=7668 RepID=A0A7M7PJG4_STRPU|nr:mucin-19 isoform X2 [Strongylocentrotus purpuratus]